MRRILITSLLLSPMLFTASAVASHPGSDASAPTQDLRVSTGVTAPSLLSSSNIDLSPYTESLPNKSSVVLSIKVDEQGRPNDIQVVKPKNPILDERVVDAVSKFRFHPAMLDEQAVPVNMNLTVNVEK